MSLQYGEVIIVTPEPRGNFREEIHVGTSLPGTCVTVLAATEPVNGKFSYEPYNTDADGAQSEVCVLLEDELQGSLVTTAYATGVTARHYWPQAGDLLQMLVANVSGTPDNFQIGDLMMIEDGTGKLLITTGSVEMESFKIMETVGDDSSGALTADTHVLVMYTGH